MKTLRTRSILGLLALVGCGGAAPRDAGSPEPRSMSSSRRSFAPAEGPVTALAPAPGPRLSVLSFNINFGVGHDPVHPALVADVDADLVLLQETTEASEAAFRGALAERYPHILFRDCCNAGGLGVLSKHPIREHDYLEPTVGWFPAWRIVVDTPLGPVQALNVHLRPPMSDGGSWVAGYFSTRGVRRDEIAAFWAALDPELPTVVGGDFNENAEGQAVAFLADKGLLSALPQFQPRAKTWRWTTRVGKIRAMLDHVVVGNGLRTHDAAVIERGRSDHFAVLAVLGPAS